ncbi:SDR family NAD(P)-dependent oxidoreductase [Mesorhizobium marinum]|uniref:SDR family NAD(P)-dependent oxidoreductase n=1 Tax=Mesorhizobium marinum TaxID=3228790 RepID=A0ABV3QXT7_9HYPH
MVERLLEGRRALVTGVSDPRSIGYGVASLFLRAGAEVAIVDRDPDKVAATAASLGQGAFPFAADIGEESSVLALFGALRERWDGLDVLVNNAGIAQPGKVDAISTADFDRMIGVNLRGTFLVSREAVGLMAAGASIVCIASIAAQRGGGLMGGSHYAASKGGVVGLVRGMARDLGPRGIRVNAVNPGVIWTGMTIGFYDDALEKKVLEQIPLNEFGTPEDVAMACLYLGSSMSRYVTGVCLDVNGGMYMS